MPAWPSLGLSKIEAMTTETQPKRPPSDRGQGRKPKPPEQRMVVVPLRMTPAQKDKLTDLGGAKWVRDRLDEAPGQRLD